MGVSLKHLSLTLLLAGWASVGSVACGAEDSSGGPGSEDDSRNPGYDGKKAEGNEAPGTPESRVRAELPWEVVSNQGETVLPNAFYAEAIDNEQIMPLAIAGRPVIDRLVYPTIGNPNLYDKADAKDDLLLVLRVEEEALAHLSPNFDAAAPAPRENLVKVQLAHESDDDGLAFFLVPRSARDPQTNSPEAIEPSRGTIRIKPSSLLANTIDPDMPASFKKRRTLRAVFDQAALADVPPALYDVRFEVRKGGKLVSLPGASGGVFEAQYNALRVFPSTAEQYSILNVTDTQFSVGSTYQSYTAARLDEFVYFVNTTIDPVVRNAAFISFNGDLHNGGSPGSILQKAVANTYQEEARGILEALKYLTIPIFLTPGNHDAYTSTGQVPGYVKTADNVVGAQMKDVVEKASPKAWPGYRWEDFEAFLGKTNKDELRGGYHTDIYAGAHVRNVAKTFKEGFVEVPRKDRNFVLYDGVYQWQRTYGPRYTSWSFGKNRYVSLDTAEIRQHRRSGWGMFIVNYGGGMSPVQVDWLDREIEHSKAAGEDVVLLAHHDPRGGHKGKDFGYYFAQVSYNGVGQTVLAYLASHAFNPVVCEKPGWVVSGATEENCLHDGLQEWMRPDPELDCAPSEKKNGFCDAALFDPKLGNEAHRYYFSALEVIERLAKNENVRTLLLGHTHYHSLEMAREGDSLVPDELPTKSDEAYASLEVNDPVRGNAYGGGTGDSYDPNDVSLEEIKEQNARFVAQYKSAVQAHTTKIAGKGHELMILRLTSNADLTHQTVSGKKMLGFSVLDVTKKGDSRGYDAPQINKIHYFVNVGADKFDTVGNLEFDREKSLKVKDAANPVGIMFKGGPI